MRNTKEKLKIIVDNTVVEGITCFSIQAKYDINCKRESCPNWINNPDSNNCTIIAAQDGPKTLQDIGKIFKLTRMRICQIEKGIHKKIKNTK
jgi:Sigma-70, region 4